MEFLFWTCTTCAVSTMFQLFSSSSTWTTLFYAFSELRPFWNRGAGVSWWPEMKMCTSFSSKIIWPVPPGKAAAPKRMKVSVGWNMAHRSLRNLGPGKVRMGEETSVKSVQCGAVRTCAYKYTPGNMALLPRAVHPHLSPASSLLTLFWVSCISSCLGSPARCTSGCMHITECQDFHIDSFLPLQQFPQAEWGAFSVHVCVCVHVFISTTAATLQNLPVWSFQLCSAWKANRAKPKETTSESQFISRDLHLLLQSWELPVTLGRTSSKKPPREGDQGPGELAHLPRRLQPMAAVLRTGKDAHVWHRCCSSHSILPTAFGWISHTDSTMPFPLGWRPPALCCLQLLSGGSLAPLSSAHTATPSSSWKMRNWTQLMLFPSPTAVETWRQCMSTLKNTASNSTIWRFFFFCYTITYQSHLLLLYLKSMGTKIESWPQFISSV